MAGESTIRANNEFDVLGSLLNLVNSGRGASSGGTVTTAGGETVQTGGGGTSSVSSYTSPGDTSALRALLGELGGADYQGVLESIFAQAGGKIPGFMGALQNSVGARSGGNSAVQAMLQKLLSETALQGQAQIADLGLRNASIRAQLGANIAQATRGTHQSQRSVQTANPVRTTRTPATQVTTPTKQPYGIGEMAGLLGLLSAGKGIYGEMKKGGGQEPAPVFDSQGSIVTSADRMGGEITSDPWLQAGPGIQSNGIFSGSMGPNFLSDTGLNWGGSQPGFTDFLSNGGGGFDLGNIDYGNAGSNFDWGGDFNLEGMFDFGNSSADAFQFAENNDWLGF